eukprot:CAMPEP_0195292892 /NCGR_PEP_ID=MMETSP0707-20130614/11139_1 /TAXON_ID=33640 /ORGANISM="Asterionellopsis glacialis, Strain CCMP134" /LENGTH=197 /DNA_ID=CAMNT_0040353483 /DNA_START=120 /DNA_END=710 /DNA_ORIENTATION=+
MTIEVEVFGVLSGIVLLGLSQPLIKELYEIMIGSHHTMGYVLRSEVEETEVGEDSLYRSTSASRSGSSDGDCYRYIVAFVITTTTTSPTNHAHPENNDSTATVYDNEQRHTTTTTTTSTAMPLHTTLPQEQQYRFYSTIMRNAAHTPRQKVWVYYNPKNPHQADEFSPFYFIFVLYLVMIPLALFMVSFSLLFVRYY